MAITIDDRRVDQKPEVDLPPLENGEQLDQPTFHARYEAMPPGTRAELIEGIVYVMPSPVSRKHAEPHGLVVGWLFTFVARCPGVRLCDNQTVVLGEESEVQPDACLYRPPSLAGPTWDARGYMHGAPDLVVEVSVSSTAYDLHQKKSAYERAGVPEYVVLALREGEVRWHVLEEGRYAQIPPDADGILRSRQFAGLWLDPGALIREDAARLEAVTRRGLRSAAHREWLSRTKARKD